MNGVTSSGRWLLVTLVLVIGGIVLMALLHTPVSRRAVMGFASNFLSDRYSIQMQAERLDYNLLTLDFELHGLSLARQTEPPFFTAGRVHADLPWSAISGSLELTVVEADSSTLSL